MQALRSLFTRTAAQQAASSSAVAPAAPVALSAEQLAQVSGGLPRVGGLRGAEAQAVEAPLPRVS